MHIFHWKMLLGQRTPFQQNLSVKYLHRKPIGFILLRPRSWEGAQFTLTPEYSISTTEGCLNVISAYLRPVVIVSSVSPWFYRPWFGRSYKNRWANNLLEDRLTLEVSMCFGNSWSSVKPRPIRPWFIRPWFGRSFKNHRSLDSAHNNVLLCRLTFNEIFLGVELGPVPNRRLQYRP